MSFLVIGEYNANNCNDTYKMTFNVHRVHKHNSSSEGDASATRTNSFANRGSISTSRDDRLSLPTHVSASAPEDGQDNSISAINSFHHAGSHFKINGDEFKSSVSRSEILTAVSDGQADVTTGNNNDVGGVLTNRTHRPAQFARTSADKVSTDSMGDLHRHSTASARNNVKGYDGIVRNASIISNQERFIIQSTSSSIFQWIKLSNFTADIHL